MRFWKRKFDVTVTLSVDKNFIDKWSTLHAWREIIFEAGGKRYNTRLEFVVHLLEDAGIKIKNRPILWSDVEEKK